MPNQETELPYQPTTEEQSAFDVCHQIYRGCREQVEVSRRISATDFSAKKSGQWRPDRKPRAEDFIADFSRAGEDALQRGGAHSRLILFRVYYLQGAHYENARKFLGLSEIGWVRWTEEIRKIVGLELVRRGMYPPKDYFEEFTHTGEMGRNVEA